MECGIGYCQGTTKGALQWKLIRPYVVLTALFMTALYLQSCSCWINDARLGGG